MNKEFERITELTRDFPAHPNVLHTIGDDTAVLNDYTLINVDTLVENDHFTLAWSTPEQIGKKAMEVNVSDIAAMGGYPTYGLISLVITKDTPTGWMHKLYDGIKDVCKKYNCTIIGGDTTKGALHMISITLFGKTTPENLCLRSSAKPGDLVCVTGEVGGSTAGYKTLRAGEKLTPYIQKRHLEPVARLDASKYIAPLASAMIDVSDGVASETRHIAEQSNVGVTIYEDKLPIHPEVSTAEKKLGLPQSSCALSGGEDFELLFTITPEHEQELKKSFTDYTIIGEITAETTKQELIQKNGQVIPLPGGYEHV